jgi:NADPH:quinone reductase
VDLVLEVRGKAVEESLDFLKPKGRLVYIGAAEGRWPPSTPSASCARTWRCWASGWPPSSGKGPFWRRPWASSLPRLGREMRSVVGAVFPFAEAEAAFQALLDRGHTGKIVVRL